MTEATRRAKGKEVPGQQQVPAGLAKCRTASLLYAQAAMGSPMFGHLASSQTVCSLSSLSLDLMWV